MGLSADHYRRFATLDAHGISPLFEEWAAGVAGDDDVQALIETLPRPKWQANLVFASARWNGAPLAGYSEFREWLVQHWDAVAATARTRATQTNEAGRCSVLLTQLARLDGPLALLEVGTSAGLCLFPDRYSYRYRTIDGTVAIDPKDGPSAVTLECELSGRVELPSELPEVVWRAGIDLNPIDVTNDDSLRWLETLVWPEHETRRERLRAAAAIVAADPPLFVAGDLNAEIERVAAQAPSDATLVIFHSAVLMYLTPENRARFVEQVSALDAVWVSNEGRGILLEVQAKLPAGVAVDGSFIVARNGEPVALAGGHGQYYRGL